MVKRFEVDIYVAFILMQSMFEDAAASLLL